MKAGYHGNVFTVMQTGLLASVPVPGFSELADSPLNTSRCSNQA